MRQGLVRQLRAFFVAALTATALAGCATFSPTRTIRPACRAILEEPAAFGDKSLYQLDSLWATDDNRPIKLSELSGRPQVVAMFFANCQFACPIIVNDLKRIDAALPPALRAHVGFALISFDCKRDTPAALADYRRARNLPAERWALLRGRPDDVLELAALLGIKYKEDARGQFAHSNVISLLNAQGEIVRQQIGLNQDILEMVRLIQQLAAK